MLDSQFCGFLGEGPLKCPLFEVVRPFHPMFGRKLTIEKLMKHNLTFPKWGLEYHEHEFSYKWNDDLSMCVCGEEEEYDPNDLDDPAYGSEKE